MWGGYMREVLGVERGLPDATPTSAKTDKDRNEGGGGGGEVVTAQHHGARIASADFHGAMVEVVRSRCVGRVGIRGVVVRDGKFAFVVVERGGGVKSMFSNFPVLLVFCLGLC
jgi:ribonuclease P protein subunit POP4